MLRNDITEAMKTAMRAKDQETLETVRLVMAKLKDADIAARGKGNDDGIDETAILALLQGMIKQRRESIEMYTKGGRDDLAAKEQTEITVIERFLPAQMSEEEIKETAQKLIEATGASSIKDMGKIMGVLKKDYAGQLDMSKAGGIVRSLLA